MFTVVARINNSSSQRGMQFHQCNHPLRSLFHPARSGKPIFQDGKYNHSKEVTKAIKLPNHSEKAMADGVYQINAYF
jgi:hypothetical protein